jgi:hypothetical protein
MKHVGQSDNGDGAGGDSDGDDGGGDEEESQSKGLDRHRAHELISQMRVLSPGYSAQ